MEEKRRPGFGKTCMAISITMAGAAIVPRFIRSVTKRMYKSNSKISESDFAENAPAIVKRKSKEENVDDN